MPDAALRGYDVLEVPRALMWTGLSRGAQQLAARLFSHSARRVGPPRGRGRPRRRARIVGRGPTPLVGRVRGAGRAERALAYWASLCGVTKRQARNYLRQLEAAGLVKRQHKVIRTSSGQVAGSKLILWLRLGKWSELLTLRCRGGSTERKEVSQKVPFRARSSRTGKDLGAGDVRGPAPPGQKVGAAAAGGTEELSGPSRALTPVRTPLEEYMARQAGHVPMCTSRHHVRGCRCFA